MGIIQAMSSVNIIPILIAIILGITMYKSDNYNKFGLIISAAAILIFVAQVFITVKN